MKAGSREGQRKGDGEGRISPPPPSSGVWWEVGGRGGGISVLHDLRAHVFSVGQDQGSGEWCCAAQVTLRAAWKKALRAAGAERGERRV